MDKYEFNIKIEQMRKPVNRGDYETAMKIADTIDWKKVRNANLLSMVATIYEKTESIRIPRTFCFWHLSVPRSENVCCTS